MRTKCIKHVRCLFLHAIVPSDPTQCFVLGVDDAVFVAYAPRQLKQMLGDIEELPVRRRIPAYRGIDAGAVARFVATLALLCVFVPAFIVSQMESLRAVGEALCGMFMPKPDFMVVGPCVCINRWGAEFCSRYWTGRDDQTYTDHDWGSAIKGKDLDPPQGRDRWN